MFSTPQCKEVKDIREIKYVTHLGYTTIRVVLEMKMVFFKILNRELRNSIIVKIIVML